MQRRHSEHIFFYFKVEVVCTYYTKRRQLAYLYDSILFMYSVLTELMDFFLERGAGSKLPAGARLRRVVMVDVCMHV
jgi:hypothetical protein